MKVLFLDETVGGKRKNNFEVDIDEDFCTVKELIKLRIFSEVEIYNSNLPEYFNSLVQPTDSEVTLNGYKFRDRRKVDAERQYYLAIDAYLKNSYFMLIRDKEVDSLEEKIAISDHMEVTFIKLTPLVGG